MKHNGIEYKEETLRDVIRYDGGAMGGTFHYMPADFYRFNRDVFEKFEQAADAAQAWQRRQYEACREFVMQYEKEAKI